MKLLNDFKNLFAIVGVVSIIFWTCASESTSDDSSSNLPQITGGTYQVEQIVYPNGNYGFLALNTETGVMKTYRTNNGQWIEYNQTGSSYIYDPITFTH